jgi:hypothetical protein
VSSAAQSVLGRSPTEAFQADVVGEMLVEFRKKEEWYLCLENSDWRVCNLILGSPDDRARSTDRLEEVVRRL